MTVSVSDPATNQEGRRFGYTLAFAEHVLATGAPIKDSNAGPRTSQHWT